MTPEQFITLLEDKSLLPPKTIASLRKQVASSKKDVSGTAIAKLLVKKGLLTKFQARELLKTEIGGAKQKPAGVDAESPKPGSLDDLSLSPIEESIEETIDQAPPLVESAAPEDELAPLDDLEEVEELDELEEVEELEEVDDLEEIEEFEEVEEPSPVEIVAEAPSAAESLEELSVDMIEDETPLVGEPIEPEAEAETLEGELLEDEPLAAETAAPPRSSKGNGKEKSNGNGKKRRRVKAKGNLNSGAKHQFDTPLMLIGVAGLALLLIIGGVAYWLIQYQSAEDEFLVAEEAYSQLAYQKAITLYESYLEKHPKHEKASLARVHLALSQIRQQMAVVTSDWEPVLTKTESTLKRVRGEEAFDQVYEDIADILPSIAEGLAANAREASEKGDAKKAAHLSKLTEHSVSMSRNNSFIPKPLQKPARMDDVLNTLDLVRRNLSSATKLQETIASMKKLAEQGQLSAAYDARKNLLLEYPGLETNKQLVETVAFLTKTEKDSIRKSDAEIASATDEAPSPIVAEIALADRVIHKQSPSKGIVAVVQTAGAVYGFEASSGELLWRRWVGIDPQLHPVRLDNSPQADVLVIDSNRLELLRLDSATGKLKWRLPLGERMAPPVVRGNFALLADRTGRITRVDLETGASPVQATYPNPIRISPSVHPEGKFACLVGDQSSVYLLSPDDLSCRQVVYLGHKKGTVPVPPTVALRNVLIAENWGENTSTLHVFRTDADGTTLTPVEQIRLTGHVVTPPIVQGRRIVVTTDAGQIKVLNIAVGDDEKPLNQIAERPADSNPSRILYSALLGNNDLWIADSRLSKLEIQVANGQLMAHAFENDFNGDAFDNPLQTSDNKLIVVRRRKNHAGQTVAAIDPRSGKPIWETNIAVPPAGSPVSYATKKEVVTGNANGAVFVLGADAISKRVDNTPLKDPRPPRDTLLTTRVKLGRDRVAFTPQDGSANLLIFDPAANPKIKWLNLPSELACVPIGLAGDLVAPTTLGQVFFLNPATGQQAGTPFQPRLSPGDSIQWRHPATLGEDGQEILLSDGRTKLYRLGVESNPPQLAALAESEELEVAIVSSVAALENVAFAADAENYLVTIDPSTLKITSRTDLNGRAAWGPKRVGNFVLLSNNREELLCFDSSGKLAWRTELKMGHLAGAPLAVDSGFVVASQNGRIVFLDQSTGKVAGEDQLGQALASGPVAFGNRLILSASDGTLLVTNVPKGAGNE